MAKAWLFSEKQISGTVPANAVSVAFRGNYEYVLNSNKRIYRINLSTLSSEIFGTLQFADPINGFIISSDTVEEKIFFLKQNRLLKANLDGSNVVESVLFTNRSEFDSIGCNVTGSYDSSGHDYAVALALSFGPDSTFPRQDAAFRYAESWDLTTGTRLSREGSELSSQAARYEAQKTFIPHVFRYLDNVEVFYYGSACKDTTRPTHYGTQVGYSKGLPPFSSPGTYDNKPYYNTANFVVDNGYLVFGGSKDGEPNNDILYVSNNMYSKLIAKTAGNVTLNQPFAYKNGDKAYVHFVESGFMLMCENRTFNISYTFKDSEDEILTELSDRTPVTALAISYSNSTATITLKHINEVTETVSFSIPEKTGYIFRGFSTRRKARRVEFGFGETVRYIENDITLYTIYERSSVPTDPFDMTLYQNTAEDNRVVKTDYLTSVGTLSGVLRSECSIVNPIIVIENDSLPVFNYVYIAAFNRYYYVTDITSVNKNLWRVSLRADVLMTYANGIGNVVAYVARNEFTGNDDLVDDQLPTEKEPEVSFSEIPNTVLNNQFTAEDLPKNYMLIANSVYNTNTGV